MRRRFFYYNLLISALILCCTSCENVGVRVKRDSELTSYSIQVDIIPINSDEMAAWRGTNVTKFWLQVMGGKSEINKKQVVQFTPGDDTEKSISISAKGKSHLVVISDFPAKSAEKDMGDEENPRLQFFDLDSIKHRMWISDITVEIVNDGIKKPSK
jgi:hypothetical protein